MLREADMRGVWPASIASETTYASNLDYRATRLPRARLTQRAPASNGLP
jgi:hypothetical protein